MTSNRMETDKGFVSSLIAVLVSRAVPPTKAEVEEKAAQLAGVFDYDGDLRSAVEEAMIAIDTRMGAGVSLVDVEANHDDEWVYKREGIEWTYSEAYEGYLKAEKWQPTLVQSLSDVGIRILGHLQDPTSEGSWNRRGLVIGHVQSGKTANYMGVIAKAADAGYKFIIIIAGIHNNLRKQTQERIDEGFIGRSSDPDNRVPIGVGLNGKFPHPATLTNINEDFNKNTAAKSGWKINDFSKPIILVIKKNVRTLEALHKWLKELNAQGDGRISDVPMLVIDDEADNASINTNKEDVNPTRTNAMIRRILGLFAKSCYVGYTATPFANIFINPDAYDDDAREELFPKHFIYSLDAPNTYFGPEKVFLDEATSKVILERISDCEDYLPFSHKKDDPVTELPPSLYRAIDQFIVARAIRNLRGQEKKHCSMMINVSRFVATQKAIRDFVSLREKKMREAVKANYRMPENVSGKNDYMIALKAAFEHSYAGCEFEWSEVKSVLNGVFDNLRLFVINSKSDEVLDYKKYERDGIGLTAIAIGGLSLSRGLTIEGLTVSYMYRNTKMYDTLMQMGRWFGYRPGYIDLCRLYTTEELVEWFGHIADVSEELREEFDAMAESGATPRDYGLRVQSHPVLMVTSPLKMRTARNLQLSFSGDILETVALHSDLAILAKNLEATDKLIAACGPKYVKDPKQLRAGVESLWNGYLWTGVSSEAVAEFFESFATHPKARKVNSALLRDFVRSMAATGELTSWTVALLGGGSGNAHTFAGGIKIDAMTKRSADPEIEDRYAIGRLLSPRDEAIDLDDAAWQAALDRTRKAWNPDAARQKDGVKPSPPEVPNGPSIRHVRGKGAGAMPSAPERGVLLLYPLDPKASRFKAFANRTEPVMAFGVSFPASDSRVRVVYAVDHLLYEWTREYGPTD